jgi:hypothetical protein
MTSRKRAMSQARRAANLPRYADGIRLTRGKCLGKPLSGALAGRRSRCPGRWAAVTVYLDLTDPRTRETRAQLECVTCGATWGPTAAPVPLILPNGTVRARITIALRGSVNRWRSRGTWHREGSEVRLLRDATPTDLSRALDDWTASNLRIVTARARAAERAAERDREARERMASLIARWADRDAEEAAAAAREVA